MSRKARHRRPSLAVRAGRAAAVGGAGAVAAGVVAAALPGAAAGAATLPLPVSFSADGNGSGAFNASGVPQLTLGSTGTFAQLTVNLNALGDNLAPAAPPAFTTDNFGGNSSPRWDILLANGNFLFGYPEQLGGGATADFTGTQWQAIGGTGAALDTQGTEETYSQALTDAGDILGNVAVTDAFIVEDEDQAPGTVDTLTGVTYDGETVGAGTVSVAKVPGQTVTAGAATAPLTVHATTTSSDQALTYSASGLPAGLSIDPSTGVISGMVKAAATSTTATVTVTDAYGDKGTTAIAYTVTHPAVTPVLSHGHVVSVSGSRATIAWDQTVSATDDLMITGPGAINGHTGTTTDDQAVYGGLEAGHTYEVSIQPVIDGKPVGTPGRVTFVTSK